MKKITEEDLNNQHFEPDPLSLQIHNLQILNITWFDEHTQNSVKIKDEELSKIYKPSYNTTSTQEPTITKSPELFIYKLNGYYGHIDSNSFYNKNHIIIERSQGIDIDFCNYQAGPIMLHGRSRALIKNLPTYEKITEPCLFLGGNGSFNYYHLLIEIFPKLKLFIDNQEKYLNVKTLILNKKVLQTPQFMEALQILLLKSQINFTLKFFDTDSAVLFNEVYYITAANNTLFNSKKAQYYSQYTYFSKNLLSQMQNIYLSEMKDPKLLINKIFLRRSNGLLSKHNRRNYNEQEIAEIFIKHGYKEIYIENYSFREQIFIFNNAKEIAGPTGAAWTNLIFSKPNIKLTSWLTDELSEFSCYSTLAMYQGCSMRFAKSISDAKNILHSSYHLPIKNIENLLVNL